jgi:hypothetical protein
MKRFMIFILSLAATTSVLAQKTVTSIKQSKPLTPAQQKVADMRKNAVGGFVRDARFHPLEGIEAFIYRTDSSGAIAASGYSDATGHYETNSVMPGKYNVRIFYPETNKAITVTDVIMKRGITEINLRNDAPVADTSINFLFFQPKPAEKLKVKKK